MNDDDIEIESVEDRYVHEFDTGTRISLMNDGSIRLKFPAMPPTWKCSAGAFDSLVETLSQTLGVRVQGLDKEFFSIPSPGTTTLAKVQAVLVELRRAHEQP